MVKGRVRAFAWALPGVFFVGGLVSAAVRAGTVTYEYDDALRLKIVEYQNGQKRSYNLDPAGNRLTVDAGSSVEMVTGTYSVAEGTSVSVQIARTGAATAAASVVCAASVLSPVEATAPADFTASSLTISWAAGDTATKTCSIPTTDDSIFEGDERFKISLSSPVGASLGVLTTSVITILANDNPGTLAFTASAVSVNEGATATFTVARTGGSSGAASVRCFTNSTGTATSGTDYTAMSQTLNWASGDSANKTCSVSVLADAVTDASETFNVALDTVTGAALGTLITKSATINNVVPPGGILAFTSAAVSVDEGDVATFSVARTGGTAGPASVRCFTNATGTATSGSDYTAMSQTLNWASGDSANKTCSVDVRPDIGVDDGETFNVALDTVTGALIGTPATKIGTINDVVPAGGIIKLGTAAIVHVGEGMAISIPVLRTGGSTGAVTVQCRTNEGAPTGGSATPNVDYTTILQTLSWANGESANKTCTVPTTADSITDIDETFEVILKPPMGGAFLGTPNSVTVVIDDSSAM